MREHLHSERVENPKPRFDWATIVVTAVVTGIITIITGMLLYRWQTSEPHLVFSTIETIPFSGQNQVIGIYQVSITNDGKKAVEDVSCHIQVPGANIEQKRVSVPPSLTYTESGSNDNTRLQIPSINPAETVQVSFLAVATNNLPARPTVSLRAKGISGEEQSARDEKKPDWLGFIPTILGILGASTALILYRSRRESMTTGGKHFDDQRKILAYICRIHKLSGEADRYDAQASEVSYWAEADRLGIQSILSNDPEYIATIKSILKDLLTYASITDESRSIIFYNLARLASATNNGDEMNEYLTRAKKLAPKLIAIRLDIDPLHITNNTALQSHSAT